MAPTFPELTAQKDGPDTNELARGEGLGVHVPFHFLVDHCFSALFIMTHPPCVTLYITSDGFTEL